MECDQSLKTAAYLDGELDAGQALEAEQHLAGCPACRALKEQHETLRSAFGALPYHRAPSSLRRKFAQKLVRESPPFRRNGFWLGAGSGAGATALAAALAFFLLWPGDFLVNDLFEAHQRSLIGNHLIDVASSDRHTVKPWFAGHADVSPPAVNFAAQGYTLVGGRADYVNGTRAAVVVYRHGAHVINLYSWADRGQALPRARARNGYRMLFWKEGDLDFAAVSDTAPEELDAFAALVKKAGSGE
ncbi:MAG TPA: zf-HC2 domain-containing protein [Rhizomicrobium sp.]|nr:zf-HC2 domain-containing protein [Rhizomicrobium sp.]